MFGKIIRFFSMEARPYPTPGPAHYAYVQHTNPPQFDAGGPGRPVAGQLFGTFPNVPTQAVVVNDGLGGLLQGQIALQNLVEQKN